MLSGLTWIVAQHTNKHTTVQQVELLLKETLRNIQRFSFNVQSYMSGYKYQW